MTDLINILACLVGGVCVLAGMLVGSYLARR